MGKTATDKPRILRDSDSGGSGALETFQYDDKIVRMFALATVFWAIVALLVGVIIAVLLGLPDVQEIAIGGFKPLAWFPHELNFARLRPIHTNAAIFAFVGNSIFCAIYYSTQRLCKTRMFSDLLGRLHFWGWQLLIVFVALTYAFGITQSREYAEFEWPLDLWTAVVWVGFFGVNFFGTLAKRRERHMYVALWFYIATIITIAMLHVFNNVWIPVGVVEWIKTGDFPSFANLMKSYSVYSGVQDALIQWWYGHNAVAFFLTTPVLGMMYYFLPKAAERPVFSYRLSIIHFWSLVFIYIWAGPHHLHYTAMPEWASTLGMLFSLVLWMPSWGGMINGLLTLRGAWNRVAKEPLLKFFVIGVTFYGMSTFEGPMLSIKSVNSLSHYTDWTVAHVHAGALGWNGFIAFGMLYWLFPRLFQTKLWSNKLMAAHFWIGTIGMVLYILSIYAAGITQGLMWRAFDEVGQLKYPDFVETVTVLIPMYWIRAVGGTLYMLGAIFCAVNMFMTWRARPATYEVPTYSAPALAKAYTDPAPPASRLKNNTDMGHRLDVWLAGHWHRGWERLPLKFSIWVFIMVAIGGPAEIIPLFLVKSNVPTIKSVQPFTPLEVAGRDIYIAESCYTCHSQMIRPLWAEVKRYGDFTKPGETVYEHPFQWGSRRIGPDLAREGGKQSHLWHYMHFWNPRDINEDSIMPRYPWLIEQDLAFDDIQWRVNALAMIGVPYGSLVKDDNAVVHAKAQASKIAGELEEQGGPPMAESETKKVIALIAYMQRMGTDLYQPADNDPLGIRGEVTDAAD